MQEKPAPIIQARIPFRTRKGDNYAMKRASLLLPHRVRLLTEGVLAKQNWSRI
jgi:hypothetical protein